MHFGDKMNKQFDIKWIDHGLIIPKKFQVLAITYKSSKFINKHTFLLWQVSFCVLDWSLNSFVCLQNNWQIVINTNQSRSTHESFMHSHIVQTFLRGI